MTLKRLLATLLQSIPPLRWSLRLAVYIFGPKNHVGAMGAIFNSAGQVLLVEHVFRPNYAWGLPGGWVNRGENPARAVQREIKEELNLVVQVKKLLFCVAQGGETDSSTPRSLALAYYCRLQDDNSSWPHIGQAQYAFEVISARWIDPEDIKWELIPVQRKAIDLARREFKRDDLPAPSRR